MHPRWLLRPQEKTFTPNPIRPLAAGIFEMPYWEFQIANFVSALVWAAELLLFGDVIQKIIVWLWRLL